MSKRSKARLRAGKADVGAAEFKARCLELVDLVRESHTEYIVTRHGTPVARLGPVERRPAPSLIGCLAGSVLRFDRPFDAVPAAWSLDRAGEDV